MSITVVMVHSFDMHVVVPTDHCVPIFLSSPALVGASTDRHRCLLVPACDYHLG